MQENGIWSRSMRMKGMVIVALVSLLLGLGMTISLDWLSSGSSYKSWGETESQGTVRIGASPQMLPNFIDLAEMLTPIVVNISTTQESQGGRRFSSPFGEEDPFNEFWRRFFGGPLPRGRSPQKSLGSGFIIDKNGSILTNNHVVENAKKIVVKLSDGREFEAKVVGKDVKTDIAVIKIDGENGFPVATLGDSDRLKVGEWVLAIGNPFGLDSSVTSGIVSAKGRFIGAGNYDDFIQTDAAINPGNSGGPLINLQGEVVGINSAIFSRSGGNIGIGFAIPINIAKELLPQLRETGKVTRGFLGVMIQRVTPDIAESLGLDKAQGALVASVSEDGPADRAGVKVGDVIISFDGKLIEESNDLPLVVARTPVEKKVEVKVLRDKEEVALSVSVGKMPDEDVIVTAKGELGFSVQEVTPQLAESLGLDRPEGVVITRVEPGSPGGEAGLRRGDVILEVDRKAILGLKDYRKAIGETKKGKGILFLVRRGDNTLFLALKRPSK